MWKPQTGELNMTRDSRGRAKSESIEVILMPKMVLKKGVEAMAPNLKQNGAARSAKGTKGIPGFGWQRCPNKDSHLP